MHKFQTLYLTHARSIYTIGNLNDRKAISKIEGGGGFFAVNY